MRRLCFFPCKFLFSGGRKKERKKKRMPQFPSIAVRDSLPRLWERLPFFLSLSLSFLYLSLYLSASYLALALYYFTCRFPFLIEAMSSLGSGYPTM